MQMRWLGFFIFFWLLTSCDKQTDTEDPVIEILYPAENELINLTSTLDISARLTDNLNIENVRVGLVNTDLIPLIQPVYLEIHQPDSLLHIKMKISDAIFGESQNDILDCLIQLQASDGFNLKNKYLKIRIGRTQSFVNEYIYTTFSNQNTFFWSYNILDSVSLLINTIPSDIENLIGQWNKTEYFFSSTYPPQIQAYIPGQDEFLWAKDISFPVPVIDDIYLMEDELMYADRNGQILLVHARTGNTIISVSVDAKYRITAICSDQNYLYASVRDLQMERTELLLYYRASGVFYKRFFLDYPNIDLQYCKVLQKLILFDTAGDKTIISTFDPENERMQTVAQIPSFIPKEAVYTGSTLFALYDSQQVLVFDAQTLEHNFIYAGQEIKTVIRKSATDEDLAILDGNQLYLNGEYLYLHENVGGLTLIASQHD